MHECYFIIIISVQSHCAIYIWHDDNFLSINSIYTQLHYLSNVRKIFCFSSVEPIQPSNKTENPFIFYIFYSFTFIILILLKMLPLVTYMWAYHIGFCLFISLNDAHVCVSDGMFLLFFDCVSECEVAVKIFFLRLIWLKVRTKMNYTYMKSSNKDRQSEGMCFIFSLE